MPKALYYAVRKGFRPGIYDSWTECERQVKGYKGAMFKKFQTKQDALLFVGSVKEVKDVKVPSIRDSLVIYTDGACLGQGKPTARAGYGVYFGPGDDRNFSGKLDSPPITNNRAEMMAVIKALEMTPKDQAKEIHTDSQYVRKGIDEWMATWKEKGWKNASGADVKNQDLWRRLDLLVKEHSVSFHWVKGHAGIVGNEEADRLANQGCLL